MHPWHGSRSQWIAEFAHWSLEVGKLIAQYEVPTDKEMLIIKLDARESKRFRFYMQLETGEMYFFKAFVNNSMEQTFAVRCSIFNVHQLPIEALLPEASLETSWLKEMRQKHPWY